MRISEVLIEAVDIIEFKFTGKRRVCLFAQSDSRLIEGAVRKPSQDRERLGNVAFPRP